MNRKKFFTIISTSAIGIAFLKINPIKIFSSKKESSEQNHVKVRMNPLAVNREKTGKKNG